MIKNKKLNVRSQTNGFVVFFCDFGYKICLQSIVNHFMFFLIKQFDLEIRYVYFKWIYLDTFNYDTSYH